MQTFDRVDPNRWRADRDRERRGESERGYFFFFIPRVFFRFFSSIIINSPFFSYPLSHSLSLSLSLSFRILVGNIPYGMTEEMLAALFAEVGPVKTSR